MNAPAPPHVRGRFDATVLANRPVCREHRWLTVRVPAAARFAPTLPGQFIQLGCGPRETAEHEDHLVAWLPGERPPLRQHEATERLAFLRRPFSLAGRRDTPDGAELDILYRIVGTGTAWLAGLGGGQSVDLIGPLGNAFDLPAGKSIGLMVGGGVGLPPMFYLAEALAAAGWRGCGFVGATTADLLAVDWTDQPPTADGSPALAVAQFARHDLPAVVTTDDGSCGMKGLITDGLLEHVETLDAPARRQAVVFTCGPEAMMKTVAGIAATWGIDCQVCMEQAMACGMGTCQSCVVRLHDQADPHGRTADGRGWGYRLACTDGPVFDARQVIW